MNEPAKHLSFGGHSSSEALGKYLRTKHWVIG